MSPSVLKLVCSPPCFLDRSCLSRQQCFRYVFVRVTLFRRPDSSQGRRSDLSYSSHSLAGCPLFSPARLFFSHGDARLCSRFVKNDIRAGFLRSGVSARRQRKGGHQFDAASFKNILRIDALDFSSSDSIKIQRGFR